MRSLAEALKADTFLTADLFHPLFDKMWNEEKFPEEWKDGHLLKIFLKKGRKPQQMWKLQTNQAGLRKTRSTTDCIVTLRINLEQSQGWNSDLIVNFIDCDKFLPPATRYTGKFQDIMGSYRSH
ncbi:hypothetical protein ElyMa_005499400 [Elysia marginata]|uniref:Uncharacterized protein n=1 Tax=Elysia marginata TaxID=1093978 RepID=A0AAV4ETT9_9GAST|nr:hypothetical protein ElyMa_005499400 [Elysia marginata]